jgi:hypothetical protein
MTPQSIPSLSVPRELVLSVLRGEERVAHVHKLRLLAALAQPRTEKEAA